MPIINHKTSEQQASIDNLVDKGSLAPELLRGRQGKSTISNSKSRKEGAPPGNKNALKHGLYATRFSDIERHQLGVMPPLESIHEIHMLRTLLADLLVLIDDCQDEDRRVKLYNSIFTGTQRLLFAMRTQTFLVGDNKEILTEFWDALALFQREQGL